jgi:hypothetical protein
MVLNTIQKVKVRTRPVIDYNKVMIKSQKGGVLPPRTRLERIQQQMASNVRQNLPEIHDVYNKLIQTERDLIRYRGTEKQNDRWENVDAYDKKLRNVRSAINKIQLASKKIKFPDALTEARRLIDAGGTDPYIFALRDQGGEELEPFFEKVDEIIENYNDKEQQLAERYPNIQGARVIEEFETGDINLNEPAEVIQADIQLGQGNPSVKERVIQRPDIIKLPVVRGGALRPDQFGIEGLRTYFLPQVRELASQTEDLKQEFLSTREPGVREMILRQVQIINRTLEDLQTAMNEFIENRPELGSESLLPTTSFMDNPENVIDDIQDVIDEIADNYNEMTQINQQQGFGLIQQGQGIFDFAGMVIDKLTPRKVKEKMFDALIGNTIKRITNPKTSYR